MSIRIEHVSLRFAAHTALNDISLQVKTGELVALLGPSGCGKTSLLRLIAGLEHAESGALYLHDKLANDLPLRERGVGMVFQHYALFRHMSVFENVAFGLRVMARAQRPSESVIRSRVLELLARVQLSELAQRFPEQLSGGQRQRVALARALVIEPRVLLLDEPFAALDANVRKTLRRWLRRFHDELKITTVFVTHDQDEALEVADRVVLMNNGKIEQVGAAGELYDRPASSFVCRFLGELNELQARVAGGQIWFNDKILGPAPAGASNGQVVAGVRPQDLVISEPGASALQGTISEIRLLGSKVWLSVALGGEGAQALEAELPRDAATAQLVRGDQVALHARQLHHLGSA